MAKKKGKPSKATQRSPDPDKAAASTAHADATEDTEELTGCRHINSLHKTNLKNKIYHIEPHSCKYCSTTATKKAADKKAGEEKQSPSQTPSFWMCLTCADVGCDRESENKHALHHAQEKKSHALALNLQTFQAWCYACEDDPTEKLLGLEDFQAIVKLLERKIKPTSSNKSPLSHSAQLNAVIAASSVSSSTAGSDKDKSVTGIFGGKYHGTWARGLSNLGNTCFFNSLMQVMCRTQPLLKALLVSTSSSASISASNNSSPSSLLLSQQYQSSLTSSSSLWSSFSRFLNSMRNNEKGDVFSPSELFGEISRRWPRYKSFRQQDSHELMRQLLDGLRDDEIKLLKEKGKKEDKKSETLIDHLFGGNFVKIILCERCHQSSISYEGFLDLSVPIPRTPSREEMEGNSAEKRKERLAAKKNLRKAASVGKVDATLVKKNHSDESEEMESQQVLSEASSLVDKLVAEIMCGFESLELLYSKQDLDQANNTTTLEISEEQKQRQEWLRTLMGIDGADMNQSGKTRRYGEDMALEVCFDEFFRVERLEGDNKYLCEHCNRTFSKPRPSNDFHENDEGEFEEENEGNDDDINEHSEQNSRRHSDDNNSISEGNNNADVGNHDDNHSNAFHKVKNKKGKGKVPNDSSPVSKPAKHSNPISKKSKSTGDLQPPEKILSDARLRLMIAKPPQILAVHLKRFEQLTRGMPRKIDTHVRFPPRLDLGPYIVPHEKLEAIVSYTKNEKEQLQQGSNKKDSKHNGGNADGIHDNRDLNQEAAPVPQLSTTSLPTENERVESTIYRLFGVVVHMGGLSSGHYISFSRDLPPSNMDGYPAASWIYASDSSVRNVSDNEVLGCGGYILFYERVTESTSSTSTSKER